MRLMMSGAKLSGALLTCLSQEGFLIVASGMAVHSFPSINEIREAATDEERKATAKKVLAESRAFDTHLRDAVKIRDPKKRKEALLRLQDLYEFKRSHPTVEVILRLMTIGLLRIDR